MTGQNRPLDHEPPRAPPPRAQTPIQPELPEPGETGITHPSDISRLPEDANSEEPV